MSLGGATTSGDSPFIERWGAASDGVLAVDARVRILWGNDALARLTGVSLDEVRGTEPFPFVHPDDLSRTAGSFAGLLEHPGRRSPATYRVKAAGDGYVLARVSGLNLLDDPAFGALVLEIRPVDDESRAEALATDQYEILEQILAGRPLPEILEEVGRLVERHGDKLIAATSLLHDGHLRLTAGSNLPEPIRGLLADVVVEPPQHTGAEAVRRRESAVTAAIESDPLWRAGPLLDGAAESGLAACWSVAILDPSNGAALGTLDAYRREPGEPTFEQWAVPMLGARLAGMAIDRARFVAELEHRSTHDSLTGLANRPALLARLDERLRTVDDDGTVALLFIDVDRFKTINDAHGHDLGDEVLQEVAHRLLTVVAATIGEDATVARLGGDEFVVAWSHCTESGEAVRNAEAVRSALDQPYALGPIRVTPRVSIGIATAGSGAHDDGAEPLTADPLLRNADAALNRAKLDGRNRWVFYDEALRLAHLDRRTTEADLERALDRGELAVHFQPVVSLHDGRLTGIEALVRWDHPARGLLAPAAFIPVAEDSGLVTAVDEHVLHTALPVVRRWNVDRRRRELPPLTLWVNLSARHLLQPEAVDRILDELRDGGDPTVLGIELTESALLSDPIAAAGLLARLRGAGIGVAIDDFGTGYSSLAALRSLPATHLKVDRRFVDGLLHDPRDRAIVLATLQLAHSFGLGVTAEGVETAEQADELRALGCDLAQGYLYGRPVGAADLEAVLGSGLERPAR